MPKLKEMRIGEHKTIRYTLTLDGAVVSTLGWTVEWCLKSTDDADAADIITKTNQTAGQIDAAPVNPNGNLWDVKILPADTEGVAEIKPGRVYYAFLKVTTDGAPPQEKEPRKDSLKINPTGCAGGYS